MKISWGTAIAIFYSFFVIAMVSMVIKSTHNKAQMVQENYYDKDLNYESFRQKRENATRMSEPVNIEFAASTKHVQIDFPNNMKTATGQVSLFRPSNASLDQTFPIQLTEEGSMQIPIPADMINGLWKVQVDWKSEGVAYYKESVITI